MRLACGTGSARRRAARRVAVACAAALAAALAGARASAQLGAEGEPIQTSQYTIDLYDGPMLAGARVIGLGGAYAPIAEGIAGYPFNPAAAAQRVPWSTTWFDWELDGGLTLPSSVTGTDFDNNGDEGFTNSAAIFLTGGLGLQFGDVGVGLTVDLHQYKVRSRGGETDGQTLNVNFVRALLVGAYSFFDGELVAGLGVMAHNVQINQPAGGGELERAVASVSGPAGQLGVLWAPAYLPIRAGASVRFSLPASATPESVPEGVEADEDGNFVSEGYYLPRTISLPTEIHAGVALQLFRPLNFRWVNPRDEVGAAARVKRENAAARARREEEARREVEEAKAEARQKGDDAAEERADRLEEQLEAVAERAEEAEEDRLDAAHAEDRRRRLGPYRAMPREKLLVSLAVKITTPTKDGVGLESFLRQRVERAGEEWSFSPRLGVEGEAIPGYLVLRAGSYYEPTRFRDSTYRIHGTGGLDIHIPLAWSVFGLLDDDTTFRVGGAVDGASRYFGWSVSAGLWH